MTAADLGGLDRHRYTSLATLHLNGAEVATPAWFAAADGKVFVCTAEGSIQL